MQYIYETKASRGRGGLDRGQKKSVSSEGSVQSQCGGAIGRASDLRFIGRGFEFCLGTIAQWPWASYLLTGVPLSPSSITL